MSWTATPIRIPYSKAQKRQAKNVAKPGMRSSSVMKNVAP